MRKLLHQRGLTAGKTAEMRRLIEQLGELAPPAVGGNVQAVRL